MTVVVTILIGIGAVFVTSSIDCTPLLSTFQKIISNQPIDWSGTQNCQPITNQAPPEPGEPGFKPVTTPPLSSGRCPPGYTFNASLRTCVRQGATPITGGRGV